jgi:4-carboxymuconolactone decarboxylase
MSENPIERESELQVERLTYLTTQDLTTDQKSVWREVVEKRSATLPPIVLEGGGLAGPYNAMLHAPKAGIASIALVNELRQNSILEPEAREFSILVTCAYWQSEYEFLVHAEIAISMGIPRELVDLIAANLGEDPHEPASDSFAIVRDLALSLLRAGRVTDAVYERAIRLYGEAGAVEIVNIVGVYTMLCLSMNAFEVPGPAGSVARWAR